MNLDMQSFIESYREKYPGDVVRISKPVQCQYEATAIAMEFEKRRKFPIIIFEKPVLPDGKESVHPMLLNLMASRAKLAHAIGASFDDVGFEWIRRARARATSISPTMIDRREAPCKRVKLKQGELDLRTLPIMFHHERDPGAYISAGMLMCYDPESGADNMGFHRGLIAGKEEIRMHLRPNTHDYLNLLKWEADTKDMPAAFWIGHHPAFIMGCQSSPPYQSSHYAAAANVVQAPLRLTPSETLGDDFLVPADAEFIIEGYIKAGERRQEAPFGDYTKYYDETANVPVMEVTAITHRENPIWMSQMVGHDEVFGCTFKEVDLSWAVRKAVPQVRRVYVMPWGVQMVAVIQIKQTAPGQAKSALAAALGAGYYFKIAIIVDEDIDIYDEREVIWALATRFQPAEDLFVIPGVVGVNLDPSATHIGDKDLPVGSRVGIDATRPFGRHFADKLDIPEQVKDRVKLEDFVPKQIVEQVPDFMLP